MDTHVFEPYCKVLVVSFDGQFDEDEAGYVEPDTDTYLHNLSSEFISFLRTHYHDVKGFEVIHSDISGPSSSGYPNTLSVHIGLWTAWEKSYEGLKELISSFKP